MNTIVEHFNPVKKEIISIRHYAIRPHRIYQIYKREDGTTFPACLKCKKEFQYSDLYFACLSEPDRIRMQGYNKVCYDCGIKILAEKIHPNQIEQMKRFQLEYGGIQWT